MAIKKPYIATVRFEEEPDESITFEDMCMLVGDYREEFPGLESDKECWYINTDGIAKQWPSASVITATAVVRVPGPPRTHTGFWEDTVEVSACCGGITRLPNDSDDSYIGDIKAELESEVRNIFTRMTGQEA